jgi:DNA polymerase III epsilon subunit-like protein
MTTYAFCDTECSGLDAARHHAWDIAVIIREPGMADSVHQWYVKPDLSTAEPAALRIGRYYERTAGLLPPLSRKTGPKWTDPAKLAATLASLLDGAVLVGANPSFDAGFISALLRAHGQVLTADYHLLDAGSLVLGWNRGTGRSLDGPLKMDAAIRACGLDPASYEAHTALGDARAVRDCWDTVMGSLT